MNEGQGEIRPDAFERAFNAAQVEGLKSLNLAAAQDFLAELMGKRLRDEELSKDDLDRAAHMIETLTEARQDLGESDEITECIDGLTRMVLYVEEPRGTMH